MCACEGSAGDMQDVTLLSIADLVRCVWRGIRAEPSELLGGFPNVCFSAECGVLYVAYSTGTSQYPFPSLRICAVVTLMPRLTRCGQCGLV